MKFVDVYPYTTKVFPTLPCFFFGVKIFGTHSHFQYSKHPLHLDRTVHPVHGSFFTQDIFIGFLSLINEAFGNAFLNMVLGSTAGFFAISIAKENRLEYFNTLEVYALEGNLEPFTNMIAGLESLQ